MTTTDSAILRRLWNVSIQGVKFGSVGLAATAVHVAVFSAVIELWNVEPMKANVIAFCIAFWVSFFGHFHWTFSAGGAGRRGMKGAGVRFFMTALTGFALNSLVVYAVEHVFHLPYVYATVGMIFLVPLILFIMSKYWAFVTVERR